MDAQIGGYGAETYVLSSLLDFGGDVLTDGDTDQTKSLATFPAAFDILAPAPTSENPSSSVTDVNDGL